MFDIGIDYEEYHDAISAYYNAHSGEGGQPVS